MPSVFKNMKNPDLIVAFGLLLILGVMIIPISPFILDILLSWTFAFSVIVLLMAIYTKKPLEFSTFPTVLLLSTLFRLSLNVASTRNILLNSKTEGMSAAGEIIKSFGSFVVGGNFAVGIIIFIILVIINFIVITKGAGRVAEVGARFTLDAMPGKQMAIDADLNAGLIDENEAKKRRSEVSHEADFYGSMDGASKFVRGDAIAGLLITAINIVGGVVIGMAQYDLSFQSASELFILLTVGDGLVTQIPAIVISTAAGIIITRNANDESLGGQITDQFKVHPKALLIAGSILFFFSLIPGLPKLPFLLIGGLVFFLGQKMNKEHAEIEILKKKKEMEIQKDQDERLEDLLPLELIELEVGYGLVSIVDREQNGDLLDRISYLRKQFALEWGVIIPSIRIKDNLELKPGGYSVRIKGMVVGKGELMPDHFLAMDPGNVIEKIEGIDTKEPVFELPALWITENVKEEAQYNGYTVVDLSTVVATHLTEILKNNLDQLFGREELSKLIDNFKDQYPKLVKDLIPDILNIGVIQKVLIGLLNEGVSIRDLRTIFETLADKGVNIKDADLLIGFARESLARSITEKIKDDTGFVSVITLDGNLEEHLNSHLVQTEQGTQITVDHNIIKKLINGVNKVISEVGVDKDKIVILTNPKLRLHLKRLVTRFLPNVFVIGHNEVSMDVNIKSIGTVQI